MTRRLVKRWRIGSNRPHISDRNIVARVGMVEGDDWLCDAYRPDRERSPYGPVAWVRLWEDLTREAEADRADSVATLLRVSPGEPLPEYPEGSDGAIYGSGGVHRYFLRASGEVVFSARHSTTDGVRRALDAGFTIQGKCP